METGTVSRIQPWKNGKGYYFAMSGKKYYAYGKSHFTVGSEIQYTLTGRIDKNGNFEARIYEQPILETMDNTATKMAKMAIDGSEFEITIRVRKIA